MESAERYESAFFRRLVSAERFSDAAIRVGFFQVNTPCFRSRASLCFVTPADHRRVDLFAMAPPAICCSIAPPRSRLQVKRTHSFGVPGAADCQPPCARRTFL